MRASTVIAREPRLDPKLREIRAAWSPDERRRRADTGRRRTAAFIRLFANAEEQEEIWAVGAAVWSDVHRLNG